MRDWLIVGLGNPGARYDQTRHNAGFLVVEALAKQGNLDWEFKEKPDAMLAVNRQLLLVKPQTFMNLSGKSVAMMMRLERVKISQLIIIHDDLDLSLGTVKVSYAKGPHGHNGVMSVEQELGTEKFWRVRVGVENRTSEQRRAVSGEKFVLTPMDYEANKKMELGITQAVKAVVDIQKGRYAIPE